MVEVVSPQIEKIEEPKKEKKHSNATIIFIIAIVVILIIAGVAYTMLKQNNNPKVMIKTSLGDIIVELDMKNAPITTQNFLNYVKKSHYDNTVFHRVIKGFMIQGGGFTSDGKEKSTDAPIKLESNNGLKNLAGTIAMARTNVPDSATSQFFINTVDNNFLDYTPQNPGYAVFGKVIQGMDVVKKIENLKTTTKYKMEDWPVDDVVIIKTEVI